MHVEDRGFQFGDAVYEVCEVRGGRLVDETRHMERLARSLGELQIAQPMTPAALGARACARPSGATACATASSTCRCRAAPAPRDFLSRRRTSTPTRRRASRAAYRRPRLEAAPPSGIARQDACPTSRWGRCDIKTVMLLPACLAKEAARKDEGAKEAWFVDADGFVTEGASSNAWIVDSDGRLHHPPDRQRHPARRHPHDADRRCCKREGIELVERAVHASRRRKAAREAFITSATQYRDAGRAHRRTARSATADPGLLSLRAALEISLTLPKLPSG